MAWRAIQDTVSESLSLSKVSSGAERLYWRMLSKTDPWGRLPGAAAKLKARCLPLVQDADEERIEWWLRELESVGRILDYAVDGERFIQITEFEQNQPTDFLRKRGKESRYPEPPKRRTPGIGRTRPEDSGHRPDLFTNSSDLQDTPAIDRTAPPYAAPEEKRREVEEKNSLGSRSETTTANGLPFEHELELTKLLDVVTDKDKGTATTFRRFASRLPIGALAKVRESAAGKPARYATSALKDELRERGLT